ncbi:MAG TPA: type II secretion system F family protein [Patescibacteria group bacterium]|nr:type II secretion system F family protein [Patescibacteria group bacterium]
MNNRSITLSNNDKLSFLSNFSTLLSAGIPIIEAVDSLSEDAKGSLKKILISLRANLVQGKHVYSVLEEFPQVFDEIIVNIIRASEEAGTLEIALKDLKNITKKNIEFSDKVKSALIYPSFVITVFFAILLLILTFVMPKIFTVFSRLQIKMPLATRILLFISNALLQHTVPIGITMIFLLIGGIVIYKRKKKSVMRFISSLPFIEQLSKEIDLTRFSRSLYLLLSSGVPIASALNLAQHVVMSKKMGNLIGESRTMILSGKKLSEGLKNARGYIPSIMLKIIEAGEKTGTLEGSMNEIADYLDYQVSKTLQSFTVLLEPIMIVVLGLLVGGMMLSIIGPIYGLIGQIGPR